LAADLYRKRKPDRRTERETDITVSLGDTYGQSVITAAQIQWIIIELSKGKSVSSR
jgi:hypothetical protein